VTRLNVDYSVQLKPHCFSTYVTAPPSTHEGYTPAAPKHSQRRSARREGSLQHPLGTGGEDAIGSRRSHPTCACADPQGYPSAHLLYDDDDGDQRSRGQVVRVGGGIVADFRR
jgi:hypothetical protein